jgi:hypothetical protein
MKPIKIISLSLLLASLSFACNLARKKKVDYNAIIYHDAMDEGYVFMYNTAGIFFPIKVTKY